VSQQHIFGDIDTLVLFPPPPSVGGLDLDSRSSGCARLGGEVGPPLGVVVEEVAVLVVLVRRHRHAVRAAVRRAVDDEIPSAIKEKTGPAAVRRVSPGLLDARPVHALGAPGIIVGFLSNHHGVGLQAKRPLLTPLS